MPRYCQFLFFRKKLNSLLHVLLTVTCFFIYNLSAAQPKDIDSLKKILPSLHDSERVDCLNEIIYYYFSVDNYNFSVDNKDSIEDYLTITYEEAKKLKYAHGIAVSLFQQAGIQNRFNNNFPKGEQLATESLQYYSLTNNKKYIEVAYGELGWALFAQSIYDKAMINLKQSGEWAKKAGTYEWMFVANSIIGQIYRESGNYDSAFYAFKQALDVAVQFKNTFWIAEEFIDIGDLYQAIEDYPTALEYYGKAFKMKKRNDISIYDYPVYAELFSLTHQYDSALYYYNYLDSAKADIQKLRIFLISKGEYFLIRKEYDNALGNFLRGLAYHRQFNDRNQIKRALIDIAKTYAGENNNSAALQYAREGLNMALQTKSRQYIRDAYQIIYAVYDRLHETDSAYFYYQKYVAMKDVVSNDELKGKFAAYNYEQKITLLDKEKLLQQQQLKQSAQQKIFLIIGILGVMVLGIIFLRFAVLKRKNEKHLREIAENELQLQKLESQKQFSELEMQALRAQMNPHFIFNCLSSINRFILKNKTEEASDYLTKFSRLIRMVLNNSKRSFISLEDELETLHLYLDMERLRFKDSFDYSFTYNNSVEASNIFIPPLLLQPFAENAIWHGLMHRQEKGFLNFNFLAEEKWLTCIITDNGVGREKAESLKSKSAEKQKSMGLKITTERLSLLNNRPDEQTIFTIEDITDENGNALGTRVHLKIYYKEMMEV